MRNQPGGKNERKHSCILVDFLSHRIPRRWSSGSITGLQSSDFSRVLLVRNSPTEVGTLYARSPRRSAFAAGEGNAQIMAFPDQDVFSPPADAGGTDLMLALITVSAREAATF